MFEYNKAFERNNGLIFKYEQEVLKKSRIAIAGMGGVGGVHLITLIRMGFSKFAIADPDVFELVNFNRQYGANTTTIGKSKVNTMLDEAYKINPDLDIKVFGRIDETNVESFFEDVNLFIDGIDFFEIDIRRLLFMTAYKKGIWGITAGPIGFSVAWLNFDPKGMSFDEYFDIKDTDSTLEKLVSFSVGLTPKATQKTYLSLEYVDIEASYGPSVCGACQMCAGVASIEAFKILTNKPVLALPYYHQFDVLTHKYKKGRLLFGNKGIIQRMKRAVLKWIFKK